MTLSQKRRDGRTEWTWSPYKALNFYFVQNT